MRYTIHIPTRWADLGRARVVRDSVYVDLFQEVRVLFFEKAVYAVHERHDDDRFVVARMQVEYFTPRISQATDLTLETWVTRIGTKSFVLMSQASDAGVVRARARTIMVGFDKGTSTSRELNAVERQELGKLLEPEDA